MGQPIPGFNPPAVKLPPSLPAAAHDHKAPNAVRVIKTLIQNPNQKDTDQYFFFVKILPPEAPRSAPTDDLNESQGLDIALRPAVMEISLPFRKLPRRNRLPHTGHNILKVLQIMPG